MPSRHKARTFWTPKTPLPRSMRQVSEPVDLRIMRCFAKYLLSEQAEFADTLRMDNIPPPGKNEFETDRCEVPAVVFVLATIIASSALNVVHFSAYSS